MTFRDVEIKALSFRDWDAHLRNSTAITENTTGSAFLRAVEYSGPESVD